MTAIAPHGGKLVNRIVDAASREAYAKEAAGLTVVTLNERQVSDVEMIAIGGFSPLEGFMGKADYEGVVTKMHLASGLPWSIPVTLAVDDATAASIKDGQDVALADSTGKLLAILHVSEKFAYDKKREAELVYRTTDEAHPGVAAVYAQGDTCLAGPIDVFERPPHDDFAPYRLDPADTRKHMEKVGWNTMVGFQTRNPVHRAHEYIIKCAMEQVDGLLLHPLVGATKGDDIPADVRMRCYEVLLENYFPADRVLLAVNPSAMRYAGPREAIFHALIRKNYGCTHFIVGRDHAGVGNYYGTYDAQVIFDEFDPQALGIVPLKYEHSFWSTLDGGMATSKTSKATPEQRISLSGTKVREMLSAGQIPPPEFTRPEIAKVLIESMKAK
jgi:sulfate adenylyltransferase